MPFICLGCMVQKRFKGDKFYSADNISLISINLRQKYNIRKRKLDEIDQIPVASKICRSCYDLTKNNPLVSIANPLVPIDPNTPDLTIYRKGLNSHKSCIFGCNSIENLIAVPRRTCELLLMNYTFLVLSNARMCSEHLTLENYWPLVKQITREVPQEDQKVISDLMFDYYKNSSMNEKCFDFDNIESIENNNFKVWFAFDKNQFFNICEYTEESDPKHVAVLLCKMRTSLLTSNWLFCLVVVIEQLLITWILQ